jgi:hypothetical protein
MRIESPSRKSRASVMLLSQSAECAKGGEMRELQAKGAAVSTGFSTASVDAAVAGSQADHNG